MDYVLISTSYLIQASTLLMLFFYILRLVRLDMSLKNKLLCWLGCYVVVLLLNSLLQVLLVKYSMQEVYTSWFTHGQEQLLEILAQEKGEAAAQAMIPMLEREVLIMTLSATFKSSIVWQLVLSLATVTIYWLYKKMRHNVNTNAIKED